MILIRYYQEQDKPILSEMLREEDIPEDRMFFDQFSTMVMMKDGEVIGFFTLKKNRNFPALQHFCIAKEHRSMEMARYLIKGFRKVMQEFGFKKALIHAGPEKLRKFTEYYFKTKAYAFTEDEAWFLVKV